MSENPLLITREWTTKRIANTLSRNSESQSKIHCRSKNGVFRHALGRVLLFRQNSKAPQRALLSFIAQILRKDRLSNLNDGECTCHDNHSHNTPDDVTHTCCSALGRISIDDHLQHPNDEKEASKR